MNTPELRERCAEQLTAAAQRVSEMTAFVGLDGFVDEIIQVVDKRDNAESFQRLPTIAKLSTRLAAAAGKSANIELVNQLTKLGGNGPIMANALASFGLKVTYLGNLGYPTLHPVFEPFAKRAEVHSIAEPGHTDALEFEDGKIMLGKHYPLKEITWENIQIRFGRDKFTAKFGSADLVGFVNWTMLPYMSDLWAALLKELCPSLKGARRKLFFDLADPEKRNREDIQRALELILAFEKHFDVVLGLNEKEAVEIGKVLGIESPAPTPDGLCRLAAGINRALPVNTVVVHPVTYALASSNEQVSMVEGPYIAKPLITTGAGDHFNSGFCLGKLLGLDNELCVLTGVTTSGHYVRTGQSPSIEDLTKMLRNWPVSGEH
jgi:sugar/nucleoside kinase (ribokinase family)